MYNIVSLFGAVEFRAKGKLCFSVPVKITGNKSKTINKVVMDSRLVGPDDLFVALKGTSFDAHNIVEKINPAAAGVVIEKEIAVSEKLACALVPSTRAILPWLCSAISGDPSDKMDMVGITGTNGKTTIARLASAILSYSKITNAVLGTAGHQIAGFESTIEQMLGYQTYHHTTPEPPELHQILSYALKSNCQAVIMEASSIGIEAFRVDAIPFQIAVYTNLTRDHLDIHPSMEAYARAKARLFHELLSDTGLAIINIDDPSHKIMIPLNKEVWTYGLKDGDLHVTDLECTAKGSSGFVKIPSGESLPFSLPLPGVHNVYNALAALGIALKLGADPVLALQGLGSAPQVPGRLEVVPNKGEISVFVDYAHTPDALQNVLKSLRSVSKGRLITIFGCGGDRDKGKRPEMGRVASEMSDIVIVTSDNPRTEDPIQIINEILAGTDNNAISFINREDAIKAGIEEARSGDVVLIAGKGHETTQEIGKVKIPFDDRLIAFNFMRQK